MDSLRTKNNSGALAFATWMLWSYRVGNSVRLELLHIYIYIGCWTKNRGIPQIIHFNRDFPYKPSILRYHYFWKHPYINMGVEPKIGVVFKNPQIIHLEIGFFWTINYTPSILGEKSPYFWFNTHISQSHWCFQTCRWVWHSVFFFFLCWCLLLECFSSHLKRTCLANG